MLTARKLSLALPLLAWGCGLSGKKVSVDDLVQPRQGTWGIYFRDLETGETVELNSSAVFHAASTMKVLVLITRLTILCSSQRLLSRYLRLFLRRA